MSIPSQRGGAVVDGILFRRQRGDGVSGGLFLKSSLMSWVIKGRISYIVQGVVNHPFLRGIRYKGLKRAVSDRLKSFQCFVFFFTIKDRVFCI